jgi:hypothetical protein
VTRRPGTAALLWPSNSTDVVVLHWPDQADEAERLDHVGVPRLLLVAPGVTPPSGTSCLEDWLRLPADDADIRARLEALAARAARHPLMPALDEHGQLSYRGTRVFLSPIDQRVAEALLASFGRTVAGEQLIGSAWSHGATNRTLRVHISRLRSQLLPLGLTIRSMRRSGYRMCDAFTPDNSSERPAHLP